ncbi:UNVERIFIED_CONTAM: hypothetical protein Slati_4255300 [Sesamum latifolium]|uniref:Uncharacterized protein n=1 Tax=Sesamum latifolium TaxID=2727402 RepID=A0AAW2TBT7_9LAMI
MSKKPLSTFVYILRLILFKRNTHNELAAKYEDYPQIFGTGLVSWISHFHQTFDKGPNLTNVGRSGLWHKDDRKVCGFVLASMTHEQHDGLDSIGSIYAPHRMIYVALDLHIGYAAAEASFGTKMIEGCLYIDMGLKRYLLWRNSRIPMLMYIDIILHFLHPPFKPSIMNSK